MRETDSRRRAWLRYISYIGLFTAICFFVQLAVGAYESDHSQAGDEAAYFVSSLMIADYLRHHLFSNPLVFAAAYYAHFPKVGIGHYPPMFMMIQAVLFLIFGPTGTTAVAFQAVIGGLYAGIPAAIVSRLGIVLGLLAGIAALSVPSVLFLVSTVMADNFLALSVTLAALAWGKFHPEKTWYWAVIFVLLSTSSILTKATAFGLVFLPLIHLSLKKDSKFLFNPLTILSALLIAVFTIPWYLSTFGLAASGFVYSWGWSYTRIAIPFFLSSLWRSLGIPIFLCYVSGLYLSYSVDTREEPFDVHVFAATSLGLLVVPMIAPADLATRYVIPAIPSIIIVAIWGLYRIVNVSTFTRYSACCVIILLSSASIFGRPHIEPFHIDRLVSFILDAHKANSLVLVSGSADLEGAVVAAFAERDRSWGHYAVRGTAVLASTNFMGSTYVGRFATPEAMIAWIRDNEIGWVIIEESKTADAFRHNRELEEALRSKLLGATLLASAHSERQPGGAESRLYSLPAVDIPPHQSDKIFSELKPSHQF